jgi:hypothetical protein
MLSRATTNAVAHRASSMRRMRRRVVNATRPYCATNGAHGEICGYSRRLN